MDLEDDLAVAFRNDEELKKRMLEGVTSTGKVLGSGSYGSVEEVKPALRLVKLANLFSPSPRSSTKTTPVLPKSYMRHL